MFSSFKKSSTILKSSFAAALLFICLQKSTSSLIVVPSTYHTYDIKRPVPLQSVASSICTEKHLFLNCPVSCLLIYQQSVKRPSYSITVHYEAAEHIFHRTWFVCTKSIAAGSITVSAIVCSFFFYATLYVTW
jgi:hypothetical protein